MSDKYSGLVRRLFAEASVLDYLAELVNFLFEDDRNSPKRRHDESEGVDHYACKLAKAHCGCSKYRQNALAALVQTILDAPGKVDWEQRLASSEKIANAEHY